MSLSGWVPAAAGRLCVLAGLALGVPPPAGAADLPVDLELVLAVDVSGSIDATEAALQRDGYLAALAHPKIVGAIRAGMFGRIAVTYVEWSGVYFQNTIVPWRVIHDDRSARAFANELADAPFTRERYTSISGAIEYAMPLFEGNGYDGTRRVIDISGDGPNNRGTYIEQARDAAVAKGIIINGLPIINDTVDGMGNPPMRDLDLYYERCVIGGPGSFIVVARGFVDFAQAIIKKLMLEIADAAPAADAPRPVRVAERVAPPCDIGERQQQRRDPVMRRDF